MRIILFILLAILSLILSIMCFGILLVSCSGHPPTSAIGMWILPASLLGAALFLYLALFFWKGRRWQSSNLLTKEGKLLPKKVVIFFISFVAVAFSFFLLSGLMLFLAIKMTMSDWIGYIIYALCTGLAVYSGVIIYKRLTKGMFNN
jgi:hypothetical protein